ncbi:hypothetical protein QYZ87_08830 [Porphyromonadaceae bacterium W3.11]|nr:hypothetical protein [Porphyromonadaceae bacterium W3.11]
MIILLYVAMILCFLTIVAKVSLLPWWKGVVIGLILLGFCLLVVPITTQSSRMVIERFLADYQAREYVAILATLECAMAFAFAFRNWHTDKDNNQGRRTRLQQLRPRLLQPLWWIQKHYVSLLIFPTLFFIQTQVLYALPGANFYIPAIIVGGAAVVLIPLMSWLCREAFPIREHREESLLFLSVALSVLVLISTNHDEILTSRPSYQGESMPREYLLTTTIFLILFIIGFFSTRLRKKKAN